MTDESDSSIDEMLSADLDGETTPAEHDRIEAQPELRSRRDELRAASEVAGQLPEPLAADAVDNAINRALDEVPGQGVTHPEQGNMVTLRRRSGVGPAPWLVAAAVILLAATGIGLIVTAKSPSRKATRASGNSASHAESKSARSGAAARSTTAPRPALNFIGSFGSPAALRTALAAGRGAPNDRAASGAAPQLSSGQADRCATVIEARDPRLKRSNRQVADAASVAGEPVVVLEYRAPPVKGNGTTTRVIALGAAACDELVNFER